MQAVVIACLVDLVAKMLFSVGFLLQKMSLNQIVVEIEEREIKHYSAKDYDELIEDIEMRLSAESIHRHKQTGEKVYTKTKLWIGFLCLALGALMQIGTLPFATMVLLSINCVFGIIFTQILSIIFLEEDLTLKYDLPAFTLLVCGIVILYIGLDDQK